MRLASIVEGHGEVDALPELVRRIAYHLGIFELNILRPIRIHRNQFFVGSPGLERAVRLAASRVGSNGAILVLFDADDDCPAELGPALQASLEPVAPVPIAVVMANREFEAWFLAAIDSLRGYRGLPENAAPPANPEAVRGAKEVLRNLFGPSRDYRESVDQVALVHRMDLSLARQRSDSFDKLWREVRRLLLGERT